MNRDDSLKIASASVRVLTAFVVVGLVTLAMLAPVFGARADRQTVTVHDFVTGVEIGGTSAKLIRTDTGASFVIHTNGLEGGDAVTVWWVVWNDPSKCAGPAGLPNVECGLGDVGVDGSSVFYATGHIIGTSGRANFGGYIQADATDFVQLLLGPGLTDPRGAEIHFVVRTHGPAVPGFLPAMIQSFNGGCESPNEELCADLQAAAFPVP